MQRPVCVKNWRIVAPGERYTVWQFAGKVGDRCEGGWQRQDSKRAASRRIPVDADVFLTTIHERSCAFEKKI